MYIPFNMIATWYYHCKYNTAWRYGSYARYVCK